MIRKHIKLWTGLTFLFCFSISFGQIDSVKCQNDTIVWSNLELFLRHPLEYKLEAKYKGEHHIYALYKPDEKGNPIGIAVGPNFEWDISSCTLEKSMVSADRSVSYGKCQDSLFTRVDVFSNGYTIMYKDLPLRIKEEYDHIINQMIVSMDTTSTVSKIIKNKIIECFSWDNVVPAEGQGCAVLEISLDKDLRISEVKVIHGIHKLLDNELVRCTYSIQDLNNSFSSVIGQARKVVVEVCIP